MPRRTSNTALEVEQLNVAVPSLTANVRAETNFKTQEFAKTTPAGEKVNFFVKNTRKD